MSSQSMLPIVGIATQTQSHPQSNTSKGIAIAMLVATVVLGAIAVYFGSQIWHPGVSLMDNIHLLMGSIPFDATFLAGCSTGLISLVAAIYFSCQKGPDQNQTVQKDKKMDLPEATRENYIDLAQQIAPGLSNENPMEMYNYHEANKHNIHWLADNYSLMLENLPEIPESVMEPVVARIYQISHGKTFVQAVSKKINGLKESEDKTAWVNLFTIIKKQSDSKLVLSVQTQITNPEYRSLFPNWLIKGNNRLALLILMHTPSKPEEMAPQVVAQVEMMDNASLPTDQAMQLKQSFVHAIVNVKAKPSDDDLLVEHIAAQLEIHL